MLSIQNLHGDRAFYRRTLTVMFPILVQNVITNFVSLLDNLMVGQIGTEPMSGVAIVNQLLFVYNLLIFGALAGAGIFTAQFYGSGDSQGVRYTMRLKGYLGVIACALFALVFLCFGEPLITLFLHEGEDALDLQATLQYGERYLQVMVWQLLPFALSQIYASTLRETGETVLPMKAGIVAVGVNLALNYVLIFGKLGAPAFGVQGAAIATVISRFVECVIVISYAHRHTDQYTYIQGLYQSGYVPGALLKKMAITGMPLLVNEALWSSGMAMLNQCYSTRGLEVVSALNISTTVSNLFFCSFLAMGTTISIMVGNLLGAGESQAAIAEDTRLLVFSVELSAATGILMALLSPYIPRLYNTTEMVRGLAGQLLLVSSAMMPFNAFTNASYFTLRSGGKTLITFLFDSGFVWGVCLPVAFFVSRLTTLPILPLYILVSSLELIKCILGFVLLRSRSWVNNLVGD